MCGALRIAPSGTAFAPIVANAAVADVNADASAARPNSTTAEQLVLPLEPSLGLSPLTDCYVAHCDWSTFLPHALSVGRSHAWYDLLHAHLERIVSREHDQLHDACL